MPDQGRGEEDRRPGGDLFDFFVLGVAGLGQLLHLLVLRLAEKCRLDTEDGLVELDHAVEIFRLTVGQAADPVKLLCRVCHQLSALG